ncbi:MAG: GntR family transcriptional regulator [Ktedonobacteraceae bacterium]|nr:GntR family transcriptional regulator [Ktedonobacteraceae bacterium]
MTEHRLTAGPLPLYHQLKLALQSEIEQGIYQAGARLPSEAELTRQYGVSRITVRQALDELEAEGLIVRRHGKGTYVAEQCVQQELVRLTDFVEDMQQAGLHPSSRVLAFEREAALPAVARVLRLPTGALVVRVDRLRFAEQCVIAYDTTWLPLRFGELLNGVDLSRETIYRVLEQRYGIAVVSGTFYITAAIATAQKAELLETTTGAPLLVIERVSYTTNNEPVYMQKRYYRPDRVQYRVSLRRHAAVEGNGNSTIDEFRAVFQEQGQESAVGE